MLGQAPYVAPRGIARPEAPHTHITITIATLDSPLLTPDSRLSTLDSRRRSGSQYAGRYFSARRSEVDAAFEACRANATAAREWSATVEWQRCRPEALEVHARYVGSGGSGEEATPPFVMRALYGRHVRLLTVVRNPVDRIETAFWCVEGWAGGCSRGMGWRLGSDAHQSGEKFMPSACMPARTAVGRGVHACVHAFLHTQLRACIHRRFHKQFWSVKGATAAGFHAYAEEQVPRLG